MSYSRYKMMQKFVNGIPTGEFTQGDLIQVGPFDSYEECQEGNASPGVTPDNPDLTYRWIVSSTPWCDGTDEYRTEKQQQSADSGATWVDSGATRRGEFVGSHSFNCGYIAERWVNVEPSIDFICESGSKFYLQKKQISHDGIHWTDSGDTRRGALIESQSSDCTYPQTRWVEIPLDVDYECVGEDKYYKEKEQITQDGITWSDTGRTRRGRGAEVHSADCGYVPPTTVTRWVDVSGEYVCQGTNKYQKQKEQISNDSGQTWQDTGNVRAGSLIESQSYDCGYVSYRWVTDQSNYVCQGYDKYAQEIEESSTDGEVWTPTGSTRTGALIERNSYDCDYISYRWVTVSGQYVCSGYSKYAIEKEQRTSDGINWTDTGNERVGTLIESQSYDCGYVSYRWVEIPNSPWCDGYNLYKTEMQQYSTDGITWQAVSPLNTRKGALVEMNSTTCGYVPPTPPTPVNDYLTFTSLEDGNTFTFNCSRTYTSDRILSYSLDNGNTWTDFESTSNVTTPVINNGETIKFKGNIRPARQGNNAGIGIFSSTGRFNVSGCPDSLLFIDNYGKTDISSDTYMYALYKLFSDCTGLVDASNLSLPATKLGGDSYERMFYGCTSLIAAPALPATRLDVACYKYMFAGCTSLTTAPALPATTLAHSCYYHMFHNCTSLTTTPALPATTLDNACYEHMFAGCTSLTTAPSILPATTLKLNCYGGMFARCASLTTAPELPATTLAEKCYYEMFFNCTNLNYIKMMATNISASDCLFVWVGNVQTNSGTFVKAPCVTIPTGGSGIPNNWTVVDGASGIKERWVDISDDYVCVGVDKYTKQKKQNTTYCGSTWSDVVPLEIRTGSLIEYESTDCGYVPPTSVNDYLTFTSLEDGNTFSFNYEAISGDMSYSLDNGNTWTSLSPNTATPVVNRYETIKFKGNMVPGPGGSKSYGMGKFRSTGIFNASGCPDSLIFGDNYCQTDLTGYPLSFFHLFGSCYNLLNASGLSLPATTLTSMCYEGMFYGCTSLTTAPALPATTLVFGCYESMFHNCTSLTTTPALPATTLDNACYEHMFAGCTSLTTAPVLPATTLAGSCYEGMFDGCTNLASVPDILPATTLTRDCYQYMFQNCKALTTAPALPATTLADHCYRYMFYGCTNLNYIKMLATDFSGEQCITLWVYGVQTNSGTFVKHPDATIRRGQNGIPNNWTIVDEDNVQYRWVNVSNEYVCQSNNKYTKQKEQILTDSLTYVDTGNERAGSLIESQSYDCGYVSYRWVDIPDEYVCVGVNKYRKQKEQSTRDGVNWADTGNERAGSLIEYESTDCGAQSPVNDYLTFTSLEDGNTFSFTNSGLSYSIDDGNTWTSLAYYTPVVNNGETIKFKGTLSPTKSTGSSGGIGKFSSTNDFYISGCPDSLLFGDNYGQTDITDYDFAFVHLFESCTKLVNSGRLLLSATTLAYYCYYEMFNGCTSLTTAPALPATTLAECCYSYMFAGCKSLVTTPSVLPATTLSPGCYQDMFYACTGLTSLPSNLLPATTLASSCYKEMFQNCRGLTSLPSDFTLPATTLANGCYSRMFENCTGLTSLPSNLLPATTLAQSCYYEMFNGCTSLTTAPALPATTLKYTCYYYMFNNCTNLNYIKMLATDISATSCLTYWVTGVASSGTFVKHPNATIPTGSSGIPSGWTVETATS